MPDDARMTIIEHLEELRKRLIRSLIAIFVAATLCYFFSDQILAFLKAPAGDYIKTFVAFGPMDGFIIKWKVSLYGGLILASPIWAWEVVQFILPGLTVSERRFLLPASIGMVVLFVFGTTLGYLSLKTTIQVLLKMFGSQIDYLPTANAYVSLVVFLLLAWGLAFETPIIILALVRTGLLTPQTLRRQRRVAYFVMFVFAEIVTPVADPIVAPTIIMIPMVLLYEVSVRLADRIAPRPEHTALPSPSIGQ